MFPTSALTTPTVAAVTMPAVMALVALSVAVTTVIAVAVSRRAVRAAWARGRLEGDVESGVATATLKQRAEDLTERLAGTEARLHEMEAAFRALQGRSGALEATAARVPDLEEEVARLRNRIDEAGREREAAEKRNAGLESELREIRAREPEVREALRRELAQFLDDKGKSFSRQNTETLEAILVPLRERIREFEKKVDDTSREGRDQHVQLKTQIEGLLGMNQRLSLEAQNLAQALKGENKTGGNWGELVLERVLESSGLEKGREYRVQPGYAGEEGLQRPDVVIDLPDNRHLVVDSKLSLVAYERYCAAPDAATAEAALDAHIQSIRLHLEQLSAKKYQDLHALNSVDFVFLFMPVEPAFIEASKRDPGLFQTAFARNIVIVSPSTLLATLRTVASIWKQEHQNRNVREIARQATALYDKFVGFLGDLDKVGRALGTAQETFAEAKSKLSTGRGNLVARVEAIRKLGAKSGKTIPDSWRDASGHAGVDADEAPDEPAAGNPSLTFDGSPS